MNSNEASQLAVFGGAERVPLGTNTGSKSDVEAAASPPRPFGLRFTRRMAEAVPVPASRLCPVRQIAVTTDGEGSPWYRVVSTSMSTTGESNDGQGSTGGEEWTPDQGMLG